MDVKLSETKSTSGWSILTAIVVVVGSPLFFTINNWIAAKDRQTAEAYLGRQIPPEYDAVLTGHGQVVEWPLGTIAQNPWGFTACAVATATWLGCCFFLVSKAIANDKVIRESENGSVSSEAG